MFDRIQRGKLLFPEYVSRQAQSFITALMQRDPDQRLGGGAGDGIHVRSHMFFAGIDFYALMRREVEVPFTPALREPSDVRYVQEQFLSQKVSGLLPVVSSDAIPAVPQSFSPLKRSTASLYQYNDTSTTCAGGWGLSMNIPDLRT